MPARFARSISTPSSSDRPAKAWSPSTSRSSRSRMTRRARRRAELHRGNRRKDAMSYQDLIYAVDEGIATVTLNRPDRMNALNRNLEAEMHRAFDQADEDRSVRVII